MNNVQIFSAKRIRCLDLSGSEAGWMVVRSGVIEEIGVGEPPGDARYIDGIVLPGFIDAHVHLTTTGLYESGLDLREARSVAELLAGLAKFVERSDDKWVIGGNFDPGRNQEERMPTRHEIDSVCDDRYVLLSRADGHSCSLNSAGFHLVELDPETPGIDLDEDGLPTGVLRQAANYAARREFFSMIPEDQIGRAQAEACRKALSRGCTAVHEMAGGSFMGNRDFLVLLEKRRDYPIEVVPYLATLDVGEILRWGLRCIGGDLFLDGSIGSRTAAMKEPYKDAPGLGHLYHSDEVITEFFLEATRAGVQAGVHAIGDAAIEQAISCIEEAFSRLGPEGALGGIRLRHRIEHFECVTSSMLTRASRVGVVPSVQPAFDAYWGGPQGMYAKRLGERARSMNPFAEMIKLGQMPAGGSDSTVTPLDPLAGVRAAVMHSNLDYAAEVSDALRMFTIWAARAAHQEAERGSLEVQKRADFCVLSRDPLDGSGKDLADIEVLETWVAGVKQFGL